MAIVGKLRIVLFFNIYSKSKWGFGANLYTRGHNEDLKWQTDAPQVSRHNHKQCASNTIYQGAAKMADKEGEF